MADPITILMLIFAISQTYMQGSDFLGKLMDRLKQKRLLNSGLDVAQRGLSETMRSAPTKIRGEYNNVVNALVRTGAGSRQYFEMGDGMCPISFVGKLI